MRIGRGPLVCLSPLAGRQGIFVYGHQGELRLCYRRGRRPSTSVLVVRAVSFSRDRALELFFAILGDFPLSRAKEVGRTRTALFCRLGSDGCNFLLFVFPEANRVHPLGLSGHCASFRSVVAEVHERINSAWFSYTTGRLLNAGSFVVLSALLIFQSANQAPLSYLASGLGPKDKTDLAHVAGLLLQHRTIVLMWAGMCALGGIIGIVSVKRAAWERLAWCVGLLMIASLTSVRTLSMDLAREYSFKPFMLKVVGTVKHAPLFFYNSEDYSVMFYAGRHIHRLNAEATAPCYILVWQNEWEGIEQKPGSAVVLLTSESTDRQIPKRGHLLLVAIPNPEVFPLAKTASKNLNSPNDPVRSPHVRHRL